MDGTIIVLIVAILVAIYFVINFFKRSREADKYTLLPLSSWFDVIQTKDEKGRNAMAYALIFQSSNLLVQLGTIPSLNTVMDVISKPDVCKTNFVLMTIQQVAVNLKEDEIEDFEKSQKGQSRAFFAEMLLRNLRKSSDIDSTLYFLSQISKKPFQGWD